MAELKLVKTDQTNGSYQYLQTCCCRLRRSALASSSSSGRAANSAACLSVSCFRSCFSLREHNVGQGIIMLMGHSFGHRDHFQVTKFMRHNTLSLDLYNFISQN